MLLPSANRTVMSICCIAVGFIFVMMILMSASILWCGDDHIESPDGKLEYC